MNELECYQFVCKMRDAYAKEIKAKKKLHWQFTSGMCLYIMSCNLDDYKHEITNFIKKYADFKPKAQHWFPAGQCKPRLELMNKALAKYESLNKQSNE